MSYENIRLATKQDMNKIHDWLKQQVEEDAWVETLLCNWDVTQKVFEEIGIYVYICPDTQEPIAYLWPDFGILEVKVSHRNKKIGREIVEFGIQKLKESGSIVIDIETINSNAARFWRKMGFKDYITNHDKTKAYKILDTELIQLTGAPVEVEIRFYSEKFADESWLPEITINPEAAKGENGRIFFRKRVAIFDSPGIWAGDPIIEIVVDGVQIFKDKCKREEAKDLGVYYKDGAFYMDYIKLTE